MDNSNTAAPAAIPSTSSILSPFEASITRGKRIAKLARLLAQTRDEDGTAEFKEECADGLAFLADEVFDVLDKLDTLWLETWNSTVRAEMAQAERRFA